MKWSSAQRCCKEEEICEHIYEICRGSFKMYINLTKTKGCLKKMTILMMTTDCSGIGWHSLSSRSLERCEARGYSVCDFHTSNLWCCG